MLENGWKDCSKCTIPHSEEGYDFVINKLMSIKPEYRIGVIKGR